MIEEYSLLWIYRYIAVQEIPVEYGGFNRENDSEFTIEDGVSEALVKGSSSETIEIPAPEVRLLQPSSY